MSVIFRKGALLLAIAGAAAAKAQTSPPQAIALPPSEAAPLPTDIVVTAPRVRGETRDGTAPEISLDADEIASYGASDIGELLGALSQQSGSQPIFLINGKPISGPGDIVKFPPEAIERVDILPPEAALAYGYRPDQRVMNMILRKQFDAVTMEGKAGLATEGGRQSRQVSLGYAKIDHDQRFNIDIGYAREGILFESERDIVPLGDEPFNRAGVITALTPGSEIDPMLSQLAGGPVTSAIVPAAALFGAPALEDFLATANLRPNGDPGLYRSLLGASERFAAGGTFSRSIAGVAATLTARYETTRGEDRLGRPAALLRISAANPFSPFSQDILLGGGVDTIAPLHSRSRTETLSLGLAFGGTLAGWAWSATGNYRGDRSARFTDRGYDLASAQAEIDRNSAALNPFAPLPAGLISPPARDSDMSRGSSLTGEFSAMKSLADFPAGPANLALKARISRRDSEGFSTRGNAILRSGVDLTQSQLQANMSVQLIRREEGMPPFPGDLSLNLSAGYDTVSGVGGADTFGAGLTWSPASPVQLSANLTQARGLPPAQQRGDAITVTPGITIFDFVEGATRFVDRIDGGNPALRESSSRRLTLSARITPANWLSFNASFSANRTLDPIGALPALTPEVEAAFPERFTRDAAGRLTMFDARPLNFERSDQRLLNWGLLLSVPLAGPEAGSGSSAAGTGKMGAAPGPLGRGIFMALLNHSWKLTDTLTLNSLFPKIDLLNGGAIGGRPAGRHLVTARANIAKGGMGATVEGRWQSASRLEGGATSLRFSGLATANLSLFSDLSALGLGRGKRWTKGLRAELTVENLFNSRMKVVDAAGGTPLAYQPAYLDPLGRTIMFGLRKQI